MKKIILLFSSAVVVFTAQVLLAADTRTLMSFTPTQFNLNIESQPVPNAIFSYQAQWGDSITVWTPSGPWSPAGSIACYATRANRLRSSSTMRIHLDGFDVEVSGYLLKLPTASQPLNEIFLASDLWTFATLD